jgi:hypothetical protein
MLMPEKKFSPGIGTFAIGPPRHSGIDRYSGISPFGALLCL